MRLSFDFHIHLSPGLSQLIERFCTMNERLSQAVDNLTQEVAENTSKVASAVAAINAFPELVAGAVADALAQADVEADEAADLIDAARQGASDQVDSILSAVDANTGPGEDTTTAPTGEDTTSGASGNDTLSGDTNTGQGAA